MAERPASLGRDRVTGRESLYVPLILVAALAVGYEALLIFTSLLETYRFRTPFAIPIFDTPFALVAIGVGYLCLERHRLRQDFESAAIGITLWVTALLAFAHILAQPDYPANPGVDPGIAPYYFFACFFVAFAGIGVALRHGDRPFPLTDRARAWIGVGVTLLSVMLVGVVLEIRALLPSLVMPPGRLTPFTLWSAGAMSAVLGIWVFWGGRRRLFGRDRDPFAGYLLLAASVWLVGLAGFLTSGGFRYSLPWYLAGLSRPFGVGLIFVGLLREQVWLYREARARQRDLEGLHGAGQALVRSLDPGEIVQTIASRAVDVLGADGAILFRLDHATQRVRAVSRAGVVTDDVVHGLELPVGQGASGLAVARRQTAWSSNLLVDTRLRFPEDVRARFRQAGLRAVIAVPLHVPSGDVFGALSVFFRTERPFYDADVELLAAFGAQASVALENARSFERLAGKARNDEMLQDFCQRLLAATDEEGILDDAVRTTRDLLGADCVGVFLPEGDTSRLRLAAGVGWRPGTVGSASLAGSTRAQREIVHIEDLADDTHALVPPHLIAHGVRAALEAPLGVREQPMGVLAAYYQAPHRFSDEESRVLTALTQQTALALDKVRLYGQLQTNLQRLTETQAQLIQADKLKALGTLLSGMAHELNNPLSTIQLSVQLLKRQHAFAEPVRRRLDVVEEECERAARIIRELLVFARRKPPERRRVDLNEVARAALSLETPQFELRGVRVVTELQSLPAIWADPHQLEQVLLNLFSNALDALKDRPGGGRLIVRSRPAHDGVVMEVEDDGPGIAAEHLSRVFDPFFTTKGVGEGTGLGLSLSIGIVDAHGGSMHAENVPTGGARFTIRLPVGEGADAAVPPRPEPVSARRARILIIEDEPALRQILTEVFSGLGHAVDEAATGEAGRQRLERDVYDLIALDLKLPDTDGKSIWRWLHAYRPGLASRVMFMTGDTMSAETEDFLREAGCPVLAKPLAIDEIARMVNAALSSPSR